MSSIPARQLTFHFSHTSPVRNGVEKLCPVCAVRFYVRASHADARTYCSKMCMGKGYQERFKGTLVRSECLQCGTEILRLPAISRKTAKHFCSHACSDAFQRGPNHANWAGVEFTGSCIVCGRTFQADRVNGVEPQHCSFACARKTSGKKLAVRAAEKRIPKTCIVCGKVKRVKPSHVDRLGTYCSRACMTKDYRTRAQGKANPNYRHGKAIGEFYGAYRRQLMQSNGGKHTSAEWEALCVHFGNICLCCREVRPLTKDHVIPVSKGGSDDIANIQPLCSECNLKKSAKTIDYRLSALEAC